MKNSKQRIVAIILIVCILSLYLIYIKPVGLYDVINSGSVRSVFISVIFNDLQEDEVNKIPMFYIQTFANEES